MELRNRNPRSLSVRSAGKGFGMEGGGIVRAGFAKGGAGFCRGEGQTFSEFGPIYLWSVGSINREDLCIMSIHTDMSSGGF